MFKKKNLSKILATLDANEIEYYICVPQAENDLFFNQKKLKKLNFSHLSYNSHDIESDTFFICKGQAFKEIYLQEAIEKGASAYLANQAYPFELPGIIVKDIRSATFVLAEYFYDYPQKELQIIGITGTKGKSTTAALLKNILDHEAIKKNQPLTGLISTVEVFDGEKSIDNDLTTPEPIELMKILWNARNNGLKRMIIEASSQALKYDRLIGIEFDTACLLNISPDHISSIEHKDFDDYLESKLKIFGKAKRVLINLDLPYLSIIQDNLQLDQTITFFSQKNSNADYFLEYFSYSENEIRVKIKTPSDSISCQAQLTGQFNAINILAALAIADMFKVDKKSIQAGISVTEVPGRMEILETNDQNILTLVDFAHNKLSFKKVFEFAEDLYSDYYKIAVFGSVGNKAKNRRYELGLVAGQYADLCILTCDNNDLEDQKNINIEIAKGIEINNGSWQEIEDRRAAIQESFDIANQHFQKTGQKVILLILGRGPEDSMRINGKDVPYLSDGEITQACISTYNKSINDLSKKKYF